MPKKKERLVQIGNNPVDLKSATPEQLEGFLGQIVQARESTIRDFGQTETIIRRELKRRRKETPNSETYESIPETKPINLKEPPLIVPQDNPIGDVNLLMSHVELTVAPFSTIIISLAKELITKTGGLMPLMEVLSVEDNDLEFKRIIVRWRLERALSMSEVFAIWKLARLVYEQDIKGFSEGWEYARYRDFRNKIIPAEYGIIFSPQSYYKSSSTGIVISRKFPTPAEATFMVQSRRSDWIRAVASDGGRIITKIEIREGQTGEKKECLLSQDSFLELVVQTAYILARQQQINRRILMTSVFKELNHIGAAAFDKSKLYGMESVLAVIERVLLLPLQQPKISNWLNFRPESILMVGVPGVGKTMLAHYLMSGDYNAVFCSIDSDRLRQDLKASGEKGISPMLLRIDNIKEITALPVILLIDDIDVVVKEDEILSKFLNILQGIRERGLHLLCSTNYPERIDDRLLEPGRLSKIVHVPLPDLKTRRGVMRTHLKGLPFRAPDEAEKVIEKMANETEGWTQRYLWELCVEAARLCGLESVGGNISAPEPVLSDAVLSLAHFEAAKTDLSSRVNLKRLQKRDEEIRDFVSQKSKTAGFIIPQQ